MHIVSSLFQMIFEINKAIFFQTHFISAALKTSSFQPVTAPPRAVEHCPAKLDPSNPGSGDRASQSTFGCKQGKTNVILHELKMSALNFLCGILLSCRRVSLCFIKLLVLFVGCATYRSFGNLIMPFFVLINNLHKLLEALTNVEKFYLSSIRFVYNQFSRSLTN